MMESVKRIIDDNANPRDGKVVVDYPKAIWNLSFLAITIVFAPLTYSNEALLLFVSLTYCSLLIGHSIGMHRLMIHRTFKSPKFVERILIYMGVLVGMSGPFGIIKIHDLRDWAQRQKDCHDFFSHRRNYFLDLCWQLTSRFEFAYPPVVKIEPHFADDTFYRFLEKTWRWHQLALAILLYYFGGWSFVIWGIFVRVSVSIVGHWTITYFCHNPGPGIWRVKDASVQASNMPGLGILTYGECWHNNHHAFPESAKIGLYKGQSDPAWRFIQALQFLRLAYNIRLPRPISECNDLYRIKEHSLVYQTKPQPK